MRVIQSIAHSKRLPLRFSPSHLHEIERLAGIRRDRRARLVTVPAAVVEHRGAHHCLVGPQTCKVCIAPMGRALAGQLGVVGLGDQNESTIGPFPYDHIFRPVEVAVAALFWHRDRSRCVDARATRGARVGSFTWRVKTWRAQSVCRRHIRMGKATAILCGLSVGVGSLYCAYSDFRRGGRVAEGARLESVYTGNRIVGSNPTPSAIHH